jgi:hypothetical protein
LFAGVSLLLVIIAQGILTAGLLPICSERLWIDQLTSKSLFWVVGALVESIFVAHLFFMETRDSERILHLASYSKRIPDEHAPSGYKSQDGIQDEQSQGLEAIDEEEQEKDAEESGHLPSGTAAVSKMASYALQNQTDSWRRKAIKKLDRGCLVVFPVTYVIFVSIMFARNDKWA